ncbi:hypothetical protein V2J09_008894 [Rumex salicifolius]
MEGVAIGGPAADSPVFKKLQEASRIYQFYLDKSTPHSVPRWIATLGFAFIFGIRIYSIHGFYIVTYALGIYLLNLLIGFLSPLIDPDASDEPLLPTKGSDEFKPFIRRLPESVI